MTTNMKARDGTNLDLPENLLRVRPDAPAGTPVDAIDCSAARARAVLMLIMGQFESEDSQTFSNDVVSSALWAVEGMIEEMRVMANYAHDTERKGVSHDGQK